MKKRNENKNTFELNESLQMKIFDRFLAIQILCTIVGSSSNTFVHGFSPIIILSFSTIFLDIAIGFWMKKKNQPFTGAWILNFIHGYILFPIIIFKSGVSAVPYLLLVLIVMGYISKPRNRIRNICITIAYFAVLMVIYRKYSPAWMALPMQAFLTSLIAFGLTCISVIVFELVFIEQYSAYNEVIMRQDKAKSEFLARMSHEIRTPVNGIIGMTEMILLEAEGENIKGYANNARTSSNTLLRIINDILDISKVESGKMEIVNTEYRLKDVIRDVLSATDARAKLKGLEFEWDVNPDLPEKMIGDEVKLIQIIGNLLSNAVKYTERGKIKLTIDGDVREDKVNLKVSVKDTGKGIKKENQAYLFDAFKRLDLEDNKYIEGTGLGLNITSRLLELMGSKLELESDIGKGSDFYFTVEQGIVSNSTVGMLTNENINDSESEGPKNIFSAPEARVLVVDDNNMNLIVFEQYVGVSDIKPVKAKSGEECIELCKKEKYDIIFLDHMMPGFDGIETLQMLKSDECENLNKDTPIIALTANAISGAREMYMEAGFTDFLTKPVGLDKLNEMLRQYLQ